MYGAVVGILSLVCHAPLGCSTPSPERGDTPSEEATGDRRVPAPVRTSIVGGDPPLAFAIRPHRWEEIAPAVDHLSAALPLGPDLASLSTAVRRRGLLDVLTRRFGHFRIPLALVREDTVWVRFDVLGTDRYDRAARVGLPVPAPGRGGHYPAATRVRFLVPSANTDALAEVVEAAEQHRPDVTIAATPAGDFCRIEVLQFAPYVDDERRAAIRDRSAGEAEEGPSPELSPPARRFLRTRSPVAAYADIDALRTWYLAHRGLEIGTAAWRATREDRRRWTVRGSAVATAIQLMTL
ncbi:MAG: hypothetical protein ABEK29_02470, partial [Bradymonadaceae bacterium]